MKKLGKKFWYAFSCVIVALAILITVLCVLFIPKDKAKLSLTVNDVVVLQNQSAEIKFECSNKDAEVTFEIVDEDIATILDNKVVAGTKIGSTTLRATATYKNDKVIKTALVKVAENTNLPLTDLPSVVNLYLIDKNSAFAISDGIDSQKSFVQYRPSTFTIQGDAIKIEDNTIVAKKEGEAVIVFRSQTINTEVYEVTVNVNKVPATVQIKEQSVQVYAQEYFEIEYVLTPIYYTGEPEVTFVCSSNIVQIVDNLVYALHSGQCEIDVLVDSVKQEGKSISVTILPNFTVTILPNGDSPNCSYENGVLKVLRGQTAIFAINLMDKEGNLLNGDDWDIRVTGCTKDRQAGFILLTTTLGGEIEIFTTDEMFSVTIMVEVVDSI